MILPIFFDEAHYTLSALLIGRDPLHTDPFVEVAYWGVPPLFTWLAALPARLAAEPLLAARLSSALIDLAALLRTWRCARALGGQRLALTAAALLVLSPYLLLYQRVAMADGLLTAVSAFGLLCAMRLARDPAATFVVVCSPQGQRLDARRAGVHLVARMPNGDGIGGGALYAPGRTTDGTRGAP